jgi:hypothetical protein
MQTLMLKRMRIVKEPDKHVELAELHWNGASNTK